MKLVALGVVIGLLIALGGDVFAHREAAAPSVQVNPAVPAADKAPLSAGETAQLSEVLDRVQREYVDDVKQPELIDDALRGMVGGLIRTLRISTRRNTRTCA